MIKKIVETSSTNDYLEDVMQKCLANPECKEDVKSVIPEFFSIYTYTQKRGKGQKGNVWHSENSKNCLASMVVYPSILPQEQFAISKAVSLGIIDYLKTVIIDHENLSIKWPNDIYYKDRKIGGILIESSIIGNQILYSILGVGININQTCFPANLTNPTSISLVTDIFYDIDESTKNIITHIAHRYAKMSNNDFHCFDEEFLNYLYKYKVKQKYVVNEEIIEAMIQGVSEIGKLQLLKDNCEVIECGFKEVKFQFA